MTLNGFGIAGGQVTHAVFAQNATPVLGTVGKFIAPEPLNGLQESAPMFAGLAEAVEHLVMRARNETQPAGKKASEIRLRVCARELGHVS